VQNVATGLQKLQDEANTQVKTCVDQINAYAEKIVALNKQIDTVEAYELRMTFATNDPF